VSLSLLKVEGQEVEEFPICAVAEGVVVEE
jgi:hypothetical protein